MKRFELTTRGHKGADFNIKCLNHNGFSGVTKSFSTVEVPGRDFPLIVDSKTRERFELKVEIIIDSQDLKTDARKIREWLASDINDLKIELSNVDGYFLGFLSNNLDIEDIIGQLGVCTLKFSCQPFIRDTKGDDYIKLENNGELTNPYNTISKPLIKITSKGNVKFRIGDCEVDLRNTDGTMYLDSEIMDAYTISAETGKTVLANYKMYSDFPTLKGGKSVYTLVSGTVTEFRIKPRWRMI